MMKRSRQLCLLILAPVIMMTFSHPALACRSQRDACYRNCNRLDSKVARFFCYLGGTRG